MTGNRRPLVLASANPRKAEEMARILDGIEVSARPPDIPDVVEDADTLEGNARLKAWAVSGATGMDAVADDTGLEVDALDGAPGVRSARFAGEPPDDARNVALLLERLASHADPDSRRARFRTVIVLVSPDGSETVTEGVCEGTISVAPRGTRGFGYDPVFVPDEGDGRTFAEMEPADKHAISHRGRALRALAEHLR